MPNSPSSSPMFPPGAGTHFIMSNRRAGRFGAEAQKRSRASMETTFARLFQASVSNVQDSVPLDETGRRTTHFQMEPDEARAKAAECPPDVILEPAIPHYPAWTMPLGLRWMAGTTAARSFQATAPSEASAPPWTMPLAARPQWTMPLWTMPLRSGIAMANPLAGSGKRFRLKITGGSPIANAVVTLFLRGAGGVPVELQETSDNRGVVEFNHGANVVPAAAFIDPHSGFWPRIVRGPLDGQSIALEPLPKRGPTAWWHEVCGANSSSGRRGRGIRIGVADTGCGPHPHLAQVQDSGAFINGEHIPNGGADVDRHGSHVCGIIGAQPSNGSGFSGAAPNATIFIARVFPNATTGANQGDIADAIDRLSSVDEVDVINLSLGSDGASEIERDAIQDALERGTLCVCAAGNDGRSPASYPARFPQCIAVSALGQNGWGALGSPTAANYPNEPDKYGDTNLFLAEFSNFGPDITCATPGNGIISTVPERFGLKKPYAALDGTSMASPLAAGLLARALSDDRSYQALARNVLRAERAREKLRSLCKSVGLIRDYEGRGMPRL